MAEDEKGNPPELWQKMAQLGWLGLIYLSNTAEAAETSSTLSRWKRDGAGMFTGRFLLHRFIGRTFCPERRQ